MVLLIMVLFVPLWKITCRGIAICGQQRILQGTESLQCSVKAVSMNLVLLLAHGSAYGGTEPHPGLNRDAALIDQPLLNEECVDRLRSDEVGLRCRVRVIRKQVQPG